MKEMTTSDCKDDTFGAYAAIVQTTLKAGTIFVTLFSKLQFEAW